MNTNLKEEKMVMDAKQFGYICDILWQFHTTNSIEDPRDRGDRPLDTSSVCRQGALLICDILFSRDSTNKDPVAALLDLGAAIGALLAEFDRPHFPDGERVIEAQCALSDVAVEHAGRWSDLLGAGSLAEALEALAQADEKLTADCDDDSWHEAVEDVLAAWHQAPEAGERVRA